MSNVAELPYLLQLRAIHTRQDRFQEDLPRAVSWGISCSVRVRTNLLLLPHLQPLLQLIQPVVTEDAATEARPPADESSEYDSDFEDGPNFRFFRQKRTTVLDDTV